VNGHRFAVNVYGLTKVESHPFLLAAAPVHR
jgi:hypothetical protein